MFRENSRIISLSWESWNSFRFSEKTLRNPYKAFKVGCARYELQEALGITAFTEESENIVRSLKAEIKGLKQALIRLQQDAQAYKKTNEVLTERLNKYEFRLNDQGAVLKMIPTMQKQIAYLKGRIAKKKPKPRGNVEIPTQFPSSQFF